MKRMGTFLSVLLMVIGLSVSAQAMLVDMNDGTIYDTATQLSWLKNANTAGTMNWSQAVAWAASLNTGSGFAGLTGWRLPATTQPDPTCSQQINPGGGFPLQGLGNDCTGSEMGHLYYVALGNTAGALTNTGAFTNLQTGNYWSGTEYAPNPALGAWYFTFGDGSQNGNLESYVWYAWAVRPGARFVFNVSGSTPVGYNPAWLIITLVSLTGVGGYLLRRRMARQ